MGPEKTVLEKIALCDSRNLGAKRFGLGTEKGAPKRAVLGHKLLVLCACPVRFITANSRSPTTTPQNFVHIEVLVSFS